MWMGVQQIPKKQKQKRAIKLVTHVQPQTSAVSLLKRAENSAIYVIINQSINVKCVRSSKVGQEL